MKELSKAFANHVAALVHDGPDAFGRPVIIFHFADPFQGDSDSLQGIIHNRFLSVVGDLGDCVYEWKEPVTIAKLATLTDIYDFGKRLRACPYMPDTVEAVPGHVWDSKKAREAAEEMAGGRTQLLQAIMAEHTYHTEEEAEDELRSAMSDSLNFHDFLSEVRYKPHFKFRDADQILPWRWDELIQCQHAAVVLACQQLEEQARARMLQPGG